MNILQKIKEGFVFFDGATGTVLAEKGSLAPGQAPETLNQSAPEIITSLHRAYIDAGANIIKTNTFGANRLKYEDPDAVIGAAFACAKDAKGERDVCLALDIGPLGKLLKPLGSLEFEEAVSIFAEMVQSGVKHGADAVLIETMTDLYELKAALLAAKENCTLPVFVSCSVGSDGKLMTGAEPEAVVALAEGLGADAVGVNCSAGPLSLLDTVKRFYEAASIPVIANPNANLPKIENGKTVYDITDAEFAQNARLLAKSGARLLGGCCGTTPKMIAALKEAVKAETPLPLLERKRTVVSSYTHAHLFSQKTTFIGERINPTGKKKLKEALLAHDMGYIEDMALAQMEQGAHILDVNVGLPSLDEAALLAETVQRIQAICHLPLQIDSADPLAMEKAVRIYNGTPLINSVSGKESVMESIFPLAKKYGGAVIALTLDENGVPNTAEGRVEIAERIAEKAKAYGIEPYRLIFDPLAMTVSADETAALVTLKALRILKEKGYKCSLGVSNVSFGLPAREELNRTFFTLALYEGLDAAILNPAASAMLSASRATAALCGKDAHFADYIANASDAPAKAAESTSLSLKDSIYRGKKEQSASLAQAALESRAPLSVMEEDVIASLDEVGRDFESGKLFLPQLLMAAEAAKSAVSVLQKAILEGGSAQNKGSVVMATVKGDVHDIGKNIVKVVLESYGYKVIDLGKDVPCEAIVEAAKEQDVLLVGLSALMTTTVPAMEEAVARLHKEVPRVKVAVGGAVLTAEYADQMGADVYCPDAMALVRYLDKK